MIKAAALAAIVVVALALLGRHLTREQSAPPPAAIPEVTRVLKQVLVMAVRGDVQRRGTTAEWSPLTAGSTLAENDAIRTGEDGSANLDLGDETTVDVAARSEMSVREITRFASRLRLEQGRLSAAVGGTVPLRIEAKDTDATAESSGGEFSVLAAPGGLVVAANKGRVRLSAKNKSVDVLEGTQATAVAGAAPTEPVAIPPSLFLKVEPPAALQKENQTTLVGKATPGAVISINGVRMTAGSTGEFTLPVGLAEGQNVVRVVAEDAAGRVQEQRVGVTVKSGVSLERGKAKWETGKEAGKATW